jgi:hypothetical protein
LWHCWSPDIRPAICNRRASEGDYESFFKSIAYLIERVLPQARGGQRLLVSRQYLPAGTARMAL